MKTSPVELLAAQIREKETEREAYREELKTQFHVTYESLKPLNIIKTTLQQAMASPDIGSGLLNTGIGLAAGFVAKKLVTGGTRNPITRMLGAVLEAVVARKTEARADDIRTAGGHFIKKIIGQYLAK